MTDLYLDLEVIGTYDKKASLEHPVVGVYEPLEVYPICGAPDILVRAMAMVMSTSEDDDARSSADEAVENCHQHLKSSAHTRGLAEKLGELVSASLLLS